MKYQARAIWVWLDLFVYFFYQEKKYIGVWGETPNKKNKAQYQRHFYYQKLSSGNRIIAASKLFTIGFSRIAVPLVSNIRQFAAILFLAEHEQFFFSTLSPIVIHNEDNWVFANIFEDKIFLARSHSINSYIQTRNPVFFSVNLILIEIFPGLSMIISRDNIECLIGNDSGIDTSRSPADSSTFYARDTTHDSESRDRILFSIVCIGIIMDLVHKG